MATERILEIRTYRIRDGERDEFGRRMSAATPLLERHGIHIVGQGPSIEDAEHYVLLRSFCSLEEREAQEEAFYEGAEWRSGPREGILELIETYHTVVLHSTPEAVQALAESLGFEP
ncbi:MAG: NIPSNAP family protein [Gaiellaceae bacterium]